MGKVGDVKIELYAIRRDGYNTDIVKSLIRHGVLIPIAVTIPDDVPDDVARPHWEPKPDVEDVDWTGGKR